MSSSTISAMRRSRSVLLACSTAAAAAFSHGTYPYLVVRHGDNVVGLRRNVKK